MSISTFPLTPTLGISFAILSSFGLLACSSDSSSAGPAPGSELLALPCTDALDSVFQGQTPPADWGPEMRGDITQCTFERTISIEEMAEAFTVSDSFVNPGLSTAVYKYRIQYWTERNEGEPLLTSAALYIPETRRADPSPLLVLGHGSVGIADQCAPSLEDPAGFNKDNLPLVYTYAGDGWVAIMPDNPGLGPPGTTAWLFSVDEGHAILDATRAARKLFREDAITSKNSLIGLSVGAHAVLSAQAEAADYGFEGSLDSVVAMSPIWLSAGIWGALISPVGAALVDPTLMSVAMQFFVGHLAAYEGEDSRLDAFLPEKREEARQLLEEGCWSQITSSERGPPSIGVSVGADLFLPEYVEEVGNCGLTDTCETELAQTWRARWVVDRPAPNATIPIFHWTGGMDTFISPGFQKCGIDRLEAQGGDLTACVEPDSDHSGITTKNAAWVRQHLDQVLLGGDAPAACAPLAEYDPTLACSIPIIPNSLDPEDP